MCSIPACSAYSCFAFPPPKITLNHNYWHTAASRSLAARKFVNLASGSFGVFAVLSQIPLALFAAPLGR